LGRWLDAAKHSEVAEMEGFAQGLSKDYEAVKAALTHEWSDAQVEGQINRLKFIKRQMYLDAFVKPPLTASLGKVARRAA
jgi:transposase